MAAQTLYERQLGKITSLLLKQVRKALAEAEAGKIAEDVLADIVALYIAGANSAAASVADITVANDITRETGSASAPLGITRPKNDEARLTKAVQTLIADGGSKARFERLAESEVLDSASRATDQAIRRNLRVTGWVRVLNAGACHRCQEWAEGGRVFPQKSRMKRHNGCTCKQQPITN